MDAEQAKRRLEYLRNELSAEPLSHEEIADLRTLAEYIDPDDVQLLKAAGIERGDAA